VYLNAYIETGKQASRCTGQVIKKSHFYTKNTYEDDAKRIIFMHWVL